MASSIMDSLKRDYHGKKVLVVGLGLQGGGTGIARFFAELGAIVTVTDKKTQIQLAPSIESLKPYPITYRLGAHKIEDFLTADMIFKGPGVPWTTPEIVAAVEKNILVEMEMSFVASRFEGKMIGITGTRGKSTTTNLIYEVLKSQGLPVYLGGGLPGISNIEYLKSLTSDDYLVAELSSWALSGFHRKKISPNIAVFTNIYPDHLNYYKNLDDYLYDKTAIFAYQKKGDTLIINNLFKDKAIDVKSKVIIFNKDNFPYELKFLKGSHNIENAAAALRVSEVLNLDSSKAVKTIVNFGGLPFRQETVGERNQITFINDTTSTTPVATIRAIESFNDKAIYLILGGNSKNLPFEELLDNLKKVRKIILLKGSFTEQIYDNLKEMYPDKIVSSYDNLDDAIKAAYSAALAEGSPAYVLFSPGATSFAMFNNEFHRGREFNQLVKKMLTDAD